MIPLYGNRLEPYLMWKYHNNPYADKPLSIVVMHGKRIVGFRGYLATLWAIGDTPLMAMCAGDTIVHEKHRMKGLSTRMGEVAFEEFKSYDFFINFSASPNALPGYLKLGFHPLVQKVPCFHDGQSRFGAPHFDEPFDNIYESISLSAEKIETSTSNKISIVRDEDYFKWRFKSPRQRYNFYYHKVGNTITDYVALSVRNSLSGYIVDFTNNNPEKLKEILRYIIVSGRYESLVLHKETTNLPLKELGFAHRKGRATYPILVKAHDWMIKDLDVKDTDNWILSITYTDDF